MELMKSIFVTEKLDEKKIKIILNLGFNSVFISHTKLDKEIVKIFHKNNVKVCAEVGLFVGEELWKKHPLSRPVSKKRVLMNKINWYAGVGRNNSAVIKRKLRMIKELAEKGYDGLL